MLQYATKVYEEKLLDEVKRRRITSRDGLPKYDSINSAQYSLERLHAYMNIYENGYIWELERFQRTFGDIMTRSLLQTLLDVDYEDLKDEVCKRKGWGFITRLGVCVTARRMGKSVAVARSLATLVEVLIFFPLQKKRVFDISVYSPGKRQSNVIGDYFKDFASERNYIKQLIQSNKERSTYASIKKGNVININFYPSNPKVSTFFLKKKRSEGDSPPPFLILKKKTEICRKTIYFLNVIVFFL